MPTAQKICGCARVNSTAMGTATSPSTRLNEISTQATWPTEVWRSRRMSGRASVTTAESASTSATVTASRGATARRTGASSHRGPSRSWPRVPSSFEPTRQAGPG
jgi:hypothetical protein